MKLHLFSSGTITAWKHLLIRGEQEGIRISVPVPFYLLEHKKGLFLFDTGQQVPDRNIPDDANFIPVLSDDERAVNLLRKRGINPGDLSGIILSHHHSDHIEGLPDFPGIPRYIRKEELQYSGIREMTANAPEEWIFPEGEFDLAGDGEILLIPTPGHTAGHQSLLLTLDSGEKVLLTADAAYTEEALRQTPPENEKNLPYWNTLRIFRNYAENGVRIITGHDPVPWNKLQTEFL